MGIGNLPKNDGVLLLVAVKDRKARIELGAGYGHSRDADSQRIMDRVIIPHFKKNQFSTGIKKGCTGLASEFAHCRWTFAWSAVVITLLIIAAVLVAISLFRSGRRGWVVIGFIAILVLALLRILGRLAHEMAESRRGLGSPGGFGRWFWRRVFGRRRSQRRLVMECPECRAVLGPVPYKAGRILFCSQCSGIWVEGDQVTEVLGNLPEDCEPLPGTEKHCPNCTGNKFHSVRFPGAEVVIDICPECRGIWFDPGEFPALRRLCQEGSEGEEPVSARLADWVNNTLAGLLGRY